MPRFPTSVSALSSRCHDAHRDYFLIGMHAAGIRGTGILPVTPWHNFGLAARSGVNATHGQDAHATIPDIRLRSLLAVL